MEISLSTLKLVLVSCGWAAATKWDVERCTKALSKLKTAEIDVEEIEDESHKKIVKKMMKLKNPAEEVTIKADVKATKEEAKDEKTSTKKATTKAVESEEEADGEEGEKKKRAPRKGGVLDAIVECLTNATEKDPVTKADIVAYVGAKLPDRAESCKATVAIQVPNRLNATKNLNIQKSDRGYWIPSAAKAAKTPSKKK